MATKPNKPGSPRQSISVDHLANVIRESLSDGYTQKTACYDHVRTKFKLTKKIFYDMFPIVYKDWFEIKEKADLEALEAATKAAALEGLRSNIQHQHDLQADINLIDKQLKGEVEFVFEMNGEAKSSHRDGIFMLPVQIQNQLRATKISYNAELSRVAGRYAPKLFSLANESDITVTVGKKKLNNE